MSKFVVSQGDWTCPDLKCANLNFAKRDKCNKCGKGKPYEKFAKHSVEIGKKAAEKSKGLFSEDDWQCKSCGNINWSKRNTCNMCNTSRVNTMGERTGYGGGFMERDEVVEYKKRDESDDEFDEFGRRKKQFRRNDESRDTKEPVKSKYQQEAEDDEEEEEEDDDEDLSKYDIWGDSDTESKPNNGKGSKKEEEEDESSSDSDSSSDRSSHSSSKSTSNSPTKGDSPAASKKLSRSRSSRSRSRSPIAARHK